MFQQFHSDEALLQHLKTHFGYDNFRIGQLEAIKNVLKNRDTLIILPTGAGKSLCYQLPAKIISGTTLVISPLISLMKDQIDFLKTLNDRDAEFINGSLSYKEQQSRLFNLAKNNYKIVYIAPERLRSREFTAALRLAKISLLVIDEAHCVSVWGHDFRPDYLYIKSLREIVGDVPIIALTATATPDIQKDICEQLNLKNPEIISESVDRPNICLEVEYVKSDEEKYKRLIGLIKELNGSGIIYCGTRQRCEEVSEFLQELNVDAKYYHAGLDAEQRTEIQNDFMNDKVRVITATNAFGMGIDKPDIRFIIHWQMPDTIEAYYQEIGRAGRDEKDSRAVLFFSAADKNLPLYFLKVAVPSFKEILNLYEHIKSASQGKFAFLEMEKVAVSTGMADEKINVVIKTLEEYKLIKRHQDTSADIKIFSKTELPELAKYSEDIKNNKINIREIISKYNDIQFENILWKLKFEDKATVLGSRRFLTFELSDKLIDEKLKKLKADAFQEYKKIKSQKLEKMMDYGSLNECRRKQILSYFGEDILQNCENCDVCLKETLYEEVKKEEIPVEDNEKIKTFYSRILSGLSELDGKTGKSFLSQILCGSKGKKMNLWFVQRAKCRSTMTEYTQTTVQKGIELLLSEGLIKTAILKEGIPVLSITSSGKQRLQEQNFAKYKLLVSLFIKKTPVTTKSTITAKTPFTSKQLAEFKDYTFPILEFISNEPKKIGRSGLMKIFKGASMSDFLTKKFSETKYFGILQGYTGKTIMGFIDSLIESGYIANTGGMYPLLFLTEAGKKILSSRDINEVVIQAPKKIEQKTSETISQKTEGDIVKSFFERPHYKKLSGDFDDGWAIDYNSRFAGDEHRFSETGELLRGLKYGNKKENAKILAEEIKLLIVEQPVFTTADLITIVPSTIKDRQYDPLTEITNHLKNIVSVPVDCTVLTKSRMTQPMKEMTNMYQKKINIRGAYIIPDVEKAKGKKIVVLDDLFDSGCTLNEITYILRKAGAEKVFALAITKTIHQD